MSKYRYEQILSKLHEIFDDKSPENDFEYKKFEDYNDLTTHSKDLDKQEAQEVLGEVTSALEKIKKDLLKYSDSDIVTVELPFEKKQSRHKRDVSNESDTNSNILRTLPEDVTENSETTTEKADIVTEKDVITEKTEAVTVKTEHANNDTESNGRRMMPDYIITTSRVKDKLLSYLEDTFNEVERKIKPLTNIKIALSNDDHYRIGYIIATIDTLEVNLKKVKNDMNLHQNVWDDEKILDLFDKIKATNNVATKLIESLKKYLPKN